MQGPDALARGRSGDGPGVALTRGRVGRTGSMIALVVWAMILLSAFGAGPPADRIPWYLGGMLAFLIIQLLVLRWSRLPVPLLYVAFALQAAIVLLLLSIDTGIDILTGLLALEAYEAAVVLGGRMRLVWVGVLLALIPISLVFGVLGAVEGLALAFVPMAFGLVLAMFAVASQDLEAARVASEDMLADLREAQGRLEAYAYQVEELAAIEERSRVAEELQATVAATLDDALAVTRAAGEVRETPAEASALIERLQALTQQALAQMRAIIAELRPPAA